MADKLEFRNDYGNELAARHADDQLNAAMNAFWETYHSESNDVWQCVRAAIQATKSHRSSSPPWAST
jgi:hypothetical protein